MTIPMLALQPFPYAGRRLIAGQRFIARGESDARLLEAVKKAMRDPGAVLETPSVGVVTNRAVLETKPAESEIDGAVVVAMKLASAPFLAPELVPSQNPTIVESGSGSLLETAGDELADPDSPPEQTTEAAQVVEHSQGAEDGSGDAEGSSLPGEAGDPDKPAEQTDPGPAGTPAAKKAKRTYTRRTTSPEKAE